MIRQWPWDTVSGGFTFWSLNSNHLVKKPVKMVIPAVKSDEKSHVPYAIQVKNWIHRKKTDGFMTGSWIWRLELEFDRTHIPVSVGHSQKKQKKKMTCCDHEFFEVDVVVVVDVNCFEHLEWNAQNVQKEITFRKNVGPFQLLNLRKINCKSLLNYIEGWLTPRKKKAYEKQRAFLRKKNILRSLIWRSLENAES